MRKPGNFPVSKRPFICLCFQYLVTDVIDRRLDLALRNYLVAQFQGSKISFNGHRFIYSREAVDLTVIACMD